MLRFPLGDMEKTQVRALARRFGLLVADKADSQDICFVPTGRYSDLIERLTPGAALPGDIMHIDGRVLGRHPGVIHYTVGQRRGLGLGGFATGAPLFVVKLDAARARVIVGPREALATRRVRLGALNWIGPGTLDDHARREELYVQIRSSQPPVQALLCIGPGEAPSNSPSPRMPSRPAKPASFMRRTGHMRGFWAAASLCRPNRLVRRSRKIITPGSSRCRFERETRVARGSGSDK